jgi:putative endonuclease
MARNDEQRPLSTTRRPGLDPGSSFFFVAIMNGDGRGGWVYIMANRYRGTIYVGVTADLPARVYQHRSGDGSDFCRRYGLDRLVWADRSDDITACIAHEKRLKRWRRAWKFALIEHANPDWRDLFDTIG